MKDTKSEQIDINIGSDKWKAQEVSTQSSPILDPGTGKPYVIRSFTFFFKPDTLNAIQQKRIPAPTQQELFNSVWPQLRIMLWGDGLTAVQDEKLPPKIAIKKKKFVIVMICEPRTKLSGVNEMLVNKPKTLNEYLSA